MRRVFVVLAWTVTIIGLWYGEENWRGRRAWNQYREATVAQGQSLDFSAYIPKPVPDDQNFAATPFLKSFILQRDNPILTNDLYARADDHVSETNMDKQHGHRQFTSLVAWQLAAAALQSGKFKPGQVFETNETSLAARAAAAPAVLEGMKPDEAVFAELRAASTREFSRYPVKYDLENPAAILIPHLAKIKGTCQRLNLEACAELAAGQSSRALADVKLILSLADSIKGEPSLISYLVRVACIDMAIRPVWEGLAEHRWTDGQLQELQARFLSYDFLSDVRQPLKSERACGIVTLDLIKKKGLPFMERFGAHDNDESPFGTVFFDLLVRVMPSGWCDKEKLNYCTMFDAQTQGIMGPGVKTISPSKVKSNDHALSQQIYGGPSGSLLKAFFRHRLMVSVVYPVFEHLGSILAPHATVANQAALACALERYRLANGQFPETLDTLAPRYMSRLPNDVITGQPYKYRRTSDGQFILYSVGWNEKDDGGVPGKTLFDKTQGDWVWSYPAL